MSEFVLERPSGGRRGEELCLGAFLFNVSWQRPPCPRSNFRPSHRISAFSGAIRKRLIPSLGPGFGRTSGCRKGTCLGPISGAGARDLRKAASPQTSAKRPKGVGSFSNLHLACLDDGGASVWPARSSINRRVSPETRRAQECVLDDVPFSGVRYRARRRFSGSPCGPPDRAVSRRRGHYRSQRKEKSFQAQS